MAFLLINPRNSLLACREMLAEPLQMLVPHSSNSNCKYPKLCLDSIKGLVSSRMLVQGSASSLALLACSLHTQDGMNMFAINFLCLLPPQFTLLPPNNVSLSLPLGHSRAGGKKENGNQDSCFRGSHHHFLVSVQLVTIGKTWLQGGA